MLNNIITFALQQRIFVLVAAIMLVAGGWRAFQELPVEAFPDVQDVQVQVITQALGQAPEEIERTISLPIEREMNGIPRLTRLRSVSITGLSVVTLTFADNTNDYFARQQVMEKLQTISLPPNIQPTMAPLTNSVGEIYRYIVEAPPEMPLYEVRALQDWVIRPALRTTPDVADIVSFGGGLKEYQVRLNPALLRKHNVTIDQVAHVLGANSANASGGLLKRGDESLVIRGIGLFTKIEDVGRVTITSRNGQPILVNQVGDVNIGERPHTGIVAFNQQDSIVQGIVLMIKGQNPSKVVAAVKTKIEELAPKLPKGVRLVPYYDRTTLVSHTVHTVGENLIVGALLVVTILVIFLRNVLASLSVAVVIPLSLLFAFILMDTRGVSANLISLGTVDFGIIIDSAVVLVEALMVRMAHAKKEKNAEIDYAGRIHHLKYTVLDLGRPILFSKAIIILAFMPIFTFQRVEGKIFTPMAYTLSFALLGAILLTITLVPTLISFTLKGQDMAEKHSAWMHGLQEFYRSTLKTLSRYRAVVISGSVAILLASLSLIPVLGSEFLPKLDEGNIWLTITLPPSTALEKTKEVERVVRNILKKYPEVHNVVTQAGRPDDGTDPKGPNNLEILADLQPRETWRFPDKEALIKDMSKQIQVIPGVPTNFSQVIQDNVEEALSGVKGEIAVKIFGPDLEILEGKSEQIASILSGIQGSADVAAIKIGGQSEVTITLDRSRMARYGINITDVNNTIQTAMGGATVNSFYEGERRFDVTLRLARPFRDAVDDVAEIPVAIPGSGNTLPLASIARIEVSQGATRISREAGGRNVSVKANLLGRDQGSFVKEAMAKVKAQVHLPPGYIITWGGQFENQQRAMKRLQIIVPLSLLMIFVLLFWAFNSLGQAVLVMLLIPFIMIGGLVALKLAHLHLSISAAVGFIALAGISVQNGVIMVEEIMRIIRDGKELSLAVFDGAVLRLRPIIMTALMAGLGLLPAALSHGIGSETQRPFAVVIVGGIISATFFTLLLQPILFPLFAKERVMHNN